MEKFQNSFLGGEIDPEFLLLGNAESANQSCRAARNVALLIGGGAVRRPGTDRLGPGRGIRYEFFRTRAGASYGVAFSNLAIWLLDRNTGASLGSLSAPWTSAQIDELTLVKGDGGLYAFSAYHPPQFISYEGAFAIAPLTFGAGVDGVTQQPYYRYADRGILMSVSGTDGPVNISFSAPVLTAQHVGTIFRRSGKELRIDTVTDPQNGTATVLQKLFPTFRVPVTNAAGFRLGQIVTGSLNSDRGEVVNIVGSAIHVLMIDSYVPYTYDADPLKSEKMVGPTGSAIINAAVTEITPATALDWDEQMISAARGYPSAGTFHRNRLVMAGFPAARRFVAASAVGDSRNFDTRSYDDDGADASDAFIEGLGNDDGAIQHLASLENLIVLGDRGVFYVPEVEYPFAAGTVRFNRIGPDGASKAHPAVVTEGVLYVDLSGGKIMGVLPTGLVGRPWEVRELSAAATPLIRSPRAILSASTVAARRHRMVFVLNADGTVAVLSYERFENFAGWALWDSPGASFQAIAVDDGLVWIGFLRSGVTSLCSLNWSTTIDEAVDYSVAALAHASMSVTIAWNGHFSGVNILDAAGVGAIAPGAGKKAGFDYAVKLEPFPPYDTERGRTVTEIVRAFAHVMNSGAFMMNGEYRSPYSFDDDPGAPPPLRTGDMEFYLWSEFGDSFVKAPTIEQVECAPLHVQGITMHGRF